MEATADKVIRHLEGMNIGFRQENDGEYRSHSPIREGSDSDAFKLTINDGEHGAWYDHVTEESGTLYELAEKLGIERSKPEQPEQRKPKPAARAFNSLADYAAYQGAPVEWFTDEGWYEATYQKRPALRYPTDTIDRVRFIDGQTPKYKPTKTGNHECWYKLDRAIGMAAEHDMALTIGNGEASTIIAQRYGVPAACITGGENKATEVLAKELLDKWSGEVYIALDCDDTGHKATRTWLDLLPDAKAIDLSGEHDGYDLANHCVKNGEESYKALMALPLLDMGNGEAEAPADDRPRIDVTNEDLAELVPAAWRALMSSEYASELYVMGSELYRVIDNKIKAVNIRQMRYMLSNAALWVKTAKKSTQVKYPPKEVIESVFVAIPDEIPRIDRVVNMPIFDKNGQLLTAGYHADQRILNQTDIEPVEMGIDQALSLIFDDLLVDFPFKTTADRTNALSYLLTPLVMEMIGNSPLFLIEAATPGTGKGLLAELINQVITGYSVPLTPLPYDNDEQRKSITGLLISQVQSIVFDEARVIGGTALQQLITASVWTDRILKSSDIASVPVRCTVAALGNNPTITGDMPRRVLSIRLEADEEKPEQRSGFKRSEGGIRKWVRDERTLLVSALITIVKHGLKRGAPSDMERGSFPEFVKVMSTIFNGCNIPEFWANDDRPYNAASDDKMGIWRSVVDCWYAAYQEAWVTPSQLVPAIEQNDTELILDGETERARTTSMGAYLKAREGTVFNLEYCKVRIEKRPRKKSGFEYRLSVLEWKNTPDEWVAMHYNKLHGMPDDKRMAYIREQRPNDADRCDAAFYVALYAEQDKAA